MGSVFVQCHAGHIELHYSEDQRQWCDECRDVVDVAPMTDPDALMVAAEANEYNELRHMLADQALLEKLRPSAPDFVERYEQVEIGFLYS